MPADTFSFEEAVKPSFSFEEAVKPSFSFEEASVPSESSNASVDDSASSKVMADMLAPGPSIVSPQATDIQHPNAIQPLPTEPLVNVKPEMLMPPAAMAAVRYAATALGPKAKKFETGFEKGAAETLSGFTTPESLATMPAFLVPYVGQALALYMGGKATYEGTKNFIEAVKEGDYEKAGRAIPEVGVGLAMLHGGAKSAKEMIKPAAELPPKIPTVSEVLAPETTKAVQAVTGARPPVEQIPRGQFLPSAAGEPLAGEYHVTDEMSGEAVREAEAKANAQIQEAWPKMTAAEQDAANRGKGIPKRFGGRAEDIPESGAPPIPVTEPTGPTPALPIAAIPQVQVHTAGQAQKTPEEVLVESLTSNTRAAAAAVGKEPSASEITSPTSVSQPEIRPPVGQEAPLRQQGETPGTRPAQGEVLPPTAQAPPANVEALPTEQPALVGKEGEITKPEQGVERPGPGAMSAGELSPEQAFITSIKNAWTDEDIARFGLEKVERGERRRWRESVLPEAQRAILGDPAVADKIVAKVLDPSGESRGYQMSDTETAILLQRKADIINSFNREKTLLDEARSIQDYQGEIDHMVKINDLSDQLQQIREASKKAGTPLGQALAARKMLMREDYSLATMTVRKIGALERPLTPEETAKIDALHKRIAELEEQLRRRGIEQAEENRRTQSGESYDETVKTVKKEKAPIDTEAQEKNIIDRMRKRLEEGDQVEDLYDYVQKLHENLQRQSIASTGKPLPRESVVNRIHDILTKELGLTLPKEFTGTEGQVNTSDLISGIGRSTKLTTDTAKLAKMDVREQEQKIGKINRYLSDLAAPKTGPARKPSSAEARRLEKEGRELARQLGIQVTDPATQLANSLSAIKTRLRNEIAEIDLAIATKKPMVRGKTGVVYDAEASELRSQRDLKKAAYDEVFGKPELTDAQRIVLAEKVLDRQISEVERQLKSGEIFPPGKKPSTVPASAILDAKRARLVALKSERDYARQAIQPPPEIDIKKANARANQLDNQIKELQRQIDTEEVFAKGRTPTVEETSRNQERLNQISELKKERQYIRDRLQPSPEIAAKELAVRSAQLDAQIKELQRQLDSGEIFPKGEKPDSELEADQFIKAKQDQIAELKKERQYARDLLQPKPEIDPELSRLQAWRTRALNRVADLKERIAKGDFASRRKEPVVPTKESDLKLQSELKQAKNEFEIGVNQDRLANRSRAQKVWDNVKNAFGTPRQLLSSWDLSAVLRQGGFITFGHPVRSLKSLGPSLSAWKSEVKARYWEQQILNRPNAKSGLYDRAKLYLAPLEGTRPLRAEEVFIPSFAEKVPGVLASQRAYVTFLNKLRADSFDAMVDGFAKRGEGLTDPELKAIGNYINVATGRGDLGRLAAAAEGLSFAFFAPRLVASRFQLLAGQPLYRGSLKTRALIAEEYARLAIGLGAVYGLGVLAGATIETDSRSADFGKLRFGKTRVDPLMGLAQNTVLLSRLATGEKKQAKGKIVPIAEWQGKIPFGSPDAYEIGADWLRTKFSPVFGAMWTALSGKQPGGQKATLGQTTKNLLVPLSWQEVADVMKEQGIPEGTAIEILNLIGMGVQTYEEHSKSAP